MAGHATGFRRLTVASMAAENLASDFEGFGDNGPRPGQILAAFKAAAPFLGYGSRIVHAIDWLFRFTAPQDWREGARPIVWPSARMQQEELQLSPTRTKAINRLLIELGLIVAKDSPNGKRYGRRDRQDRIIEAYGFDLSPMAQRFEEFARIADEGREARARMGQLRRRATIARKGLAQIFEAVDEYGFFDATWRALSEESHVLSQALRRVERLDEMEIGVAGLERRQAEAQARLESQLGMMKKDVNQDGQGADSGPHIDTYKPPLNPNRNTVIAYEGSSSGVGVSTEPEKRPQKATEHEERGRVLRLHPDELPVVAPRLKVYLRDRNPKWSDIVDAADMLRLDLDISKSLWAEACRVMGREMAAIALAIVSTKDPDYFTRTAGHYFHGMVERAKRDELHLDRTLWGLRGAKRDKSEQGRA
jgi:replication initiation protein RepC